ncbi:SDR family NAD(P)-dependent oxidoreductase [Niabella aurantiaca]|uniref:SDR family NAD(P)-dependent oxidoreductase n=1 Tax=Niabella aurantiaca TaxID=379900 RepID=UPI000381EC22|nr:SDR family NAD(P)-dependent oxidoreductase [Niabella aurantiaca]
MVSVLITGVSKGLGNELFHQFTERDYYVFGVTRPNESTFNFTGSKLNNYKIIQADLTEEQSIRIMKDAIQSHPIDLIINNAGTGGVANHLEHIHTKELSDLFNIHCLGALRVVQAVLKNLLAAQKPIVININSRLGSIKEQSRKTFRHLEVSYAYRIAKASQNMLTNCLRNEFENRIQFISLNPGKMKTGIAQVDADLEPSLVAAEIIRQYEEATFKEELGISQLSNELIEW